ncbi:MAG: hypothetical protein E7402_06065 [Ruminococcaceae bacterium]|nr:hypothetical protein [Oscillospiraceae bacterium]
MRDILTHGAVIAVIGLLTVFVVLAILWSVLELMRVVFAGKGKKPAAKTEAPAPAPVPAVSAAPVQESDDELIAVLTAAVAACLDAPKNGLRIRSYRRIESTAPVWNLTARRDNVIG